MFGGVNYYPTESLEQTFASVERAGLAVPSVYKNDWKMKNVVIRVVKSSWLPEKMATYLVSIDRLLCLAFLYGWRFFIKKISLGWLLTLTTQPSTSKLSDNPGPLRGWAVRVLDLQFGGPEFKSRLAASWICTQYSPDFKSSTTLVKGRLAPTASGQLEF